MVEHEQRWRAIELLGSGQSVAAVTENLGLAQSELERLVSVDSNFKEAVAAAQTLHGLEQAGRSARTRGAEPIRRGAYGEHVLELQKRLEAAGFRPGPMDGIFGAATRAAVVAFQKSRGLVADGVCGERTLAALAMLEPDPVSLVVPKLTTGIVAKLFPATPIRNIRENLPVVCRALGEQSLLDKPMLLMALATIRAESESFEPISEFPSRFNTSPHGRPFDRYDHRSDLGNRGPDDGERFRGRGYVQLTGRHNYLMHGRRVDLGDRLVEEPDLAGEPETAGRLLASFLREKEARLRKALACDDLVLARRLVNGGTHGFDRFLDAYRRGQRLLP